MLQKNSSSTVSSVIEAGRRLEKGISLENRDGSLRLVIYANKQKRSVSFKPENFHRAVARAQEIKDELLGEHKAAVPEVSTQLDVSSAILLAIPLADVFALYRKLKLEFVVNPGPTESRLKNLEKAFSGMTIEDLGEYEIKKWKKSRMSGVFGHGKNVDRTKPTEIGGFSKQFRQHLIATGEINRMIANGKIEVIKSQERGVSEATVRHEMKLLRQCLKVYFKAKKWHSKLDWLNEQEIMTMDTPAASQHRERRISDEELNLIFNELLSPTPSPQPSWREPKKAKPESAMNSVSTAAGLKRVRSKNQLASTYIDYIKLALFTTLRLTELGSLRWEDFDEHKSTIRLHGLYDCSRKSKTHSRNVPLIPEALKLLKKMKMDSGKEEGLIFDVRPVTVAQAFRRAADAVGIRDIRFHDIRREAVTRLHDKYGFSLLALTQFTGHADVRTLQKHYFAPKAEEASEFAKRVAAMREVSFFESRPSPKK